MTRNKARYNERMRLYMRKYRARKREEQKHLLLKLEELKKLILNQNIPISPLRRGILVVRGRG